ncbi:MAG: Rho termination factor N-terminal domain-containing protein [Solirubrobacteraceae bacterium]
MAVLDRSDLEASSIADLHSIASQIGLDGFRRLRKAELIDLILEKGDGASADAEDQADAPAPRARRRRAGTRRARSADAEQAEEEQPEEEAQDEELPSAARRTRSSRSGRTRSSARGGASSRGSRRDADEDETDEEEANGSAGAQATVEGEVEVLGNGSAFVRVSPPGASDEDVYISAAQVRRCELVSGARVSGPVRRPRRSERYASLARIDTINGEPADQTSGVVKYDTLPAIHPSERFELPGEDPTLQAIAQLTPFGRGSRVLIVGPARAGKTVTLRALLGALAQASELERTLLLLGARPEEIGDWEQPLAPIVALSFAASADAQGQALEHAIDAAKRIASRGSHALVAIDSLDGVHPLLARRALAAAKSIAGAGSLTVIATASAPFGGESTVIALDAARGSVQGAPALDLLQSGTLRPDLLVGEDGAHAILNARAALLG